MSSPSLETACLGKVPTHGDFVRHQASTPTMRAFDEWIRTGLHQLRQRHRGDWEEAYDDAPPLRFLFSGREHKVPNTLLGTLRPSRDRNERTYPFTVTCEFSVASCPPDRLAYLPLQADAFFTAAEEVVQAATDGTIPYRDLTDRVADITPSFSPRARPPAGYYAYTKDQTLGTLLGTVFDHFDDPRKYLVFKNLLDILLPQRDRPSPRLNYGLQFPLGETTDTLTHCVCFWLDAALRLLNHPEVEMSFFWTPTSPGNATPFFLLFLGPPHAGAVFDLLIGDDDNDDVYRLDRAGTTDAAQAALALPEKYGVLLEDDELSLHDFLDRL